MKVSVIIPCYNQAKFLPHAVAALQAQTLEEWECIIVDDGSTDNTAEVATNLALQDGRVHMRQKINGGSASARDLGLKHAQGEYIQYLSYSLFSRTLSMLPLFWMSLYWVIFLNARKNDLTA